MWEITILETAACLRLVWEFLVRSLGFAGAETEASLVALADPDTGCPGRTAGYPEIWRLLTLGKSVEMGEMKRKVDVLEVSAGRYLMPLFSCLGGFWLLRYRGPTFS